MYLPPVSAKDSEAQGGKIDSNAPPINLKQYGNDKGSHAIALRCLSLQLRGVQYVNSPEFITRVAQSTELSEDEVLTLFSKLPVTAQFFGPLASECEGREVFPEAREWRRQRTRTLFASLAWFYKIFQRLTSCDGAELFSLCEALLDASILPSPSVPPVPN